MKASLKLLAASREHKKNEIIRKDLMKVVATEGSTEYFARYMLGFKHNYRMYQALCSMCVLDLILFIVKVQEEKKKAEEIQANAERMETLSSTKPKKKPTNITSSTPKTKPLPNNSSSSKSSSLSPTPAPDVLPTPTPAPDVLPTPTTTTNNTTTPTTITNNIDTTPLPPTSEPDKTPTPSSSIATVYPSTSLSGMLSSSFFN